MGQWEPLRGRRRTTSHTSSKDQSTCDFPDGVFVCEPESGEVSLNPLTSAELSHDSGVYFGQSTPGVAINRGYSRRRAYTGESWPDGPREVEAPWRQSNSHLNGSRSGLNVRVSC
ncbi:unnamed protein product [Echinostoma caproni]|uniref:Uncharacterized protein n=1 Tax=Echinostoma caproni TaxID=27848 RepID=A0A183A4K0_9TREM|nr:unnamed protein product [Echinostoma caproni]